MDWDKAKIELDKKLNPEHVQPPAQGKYGEYLFAWHVINEANRIFGFGGWSYTISLQKVSEDVNQNGNNVIGYICKCALVVDGVTREDVGYGEGTSKKLGDAHEGATKEAATDALKRALRTFGNQFGLALYDKSKRNVGGDDGTVSADQFIELQSKIEKSGVELGKILAAARVERLEQVKAVDLPTIYKKLSLAKPEDQGTGYADDNKYGATPSDEIPY